MTEKTEFEEDIRLAIAVPPAREAFIKSLYTQVVEAAQVGTIRRTLTSTRRPRLAAGVSALLVVVFLLVTFTPAGQAFAYALQNLFRIVTADQLPTPRHEDYATPTYAPTFAAAIGPVTPQPTATLEPMPTSTYDPTLAPCYSDITSYECKIVQAEKRAGFDAKEFPTHLIGFAFEGAYAIPDGIWIEYDWIGGGAYLYLNQYIRNDFFDLSGAVPEDAIQEVMVGENRGQYVIGSYVVMGDPPKLVWLETARFRLRWMEGDRMYEIDVEGNIGHNFPYSDRDYLIQLASELVDQPVLQNDPRADYLTNMEDAAQLAGFTPLEPSTLPKNFQFDHGRYDADTFTLRLDYSLPEKGIGIILVWETPIDKAHLSPELEESIIEGEEVEINGYPGLYFGIDPYNHTVIWYTDDLRIKLHLGVSDIWYGGSFTKEQILEIANSVQ